MEKHPQMTVKPEVLSAFQNLVTTAQRHRMPPSLFIDFIMDRAAMLFVEHADAPEYKELRTMFTEAAVDHFDSKWRQIQFAKMPVVGQA